MDSKKIRRPLLVVAAGAALISGFALTQNIFAQGQVGSAPQRQEQQKGQRGDPSQRIERKIANMTETLKLSPTQVTRIRAILADQQTQMEALRKNATNQRPDDRAGAPQNGAGDQPDGGRGGRGGRGGHREMPPEVKAIHDKAEKQIESVLTAQQLSTYRTQQLERAKRDSTERQGRFNS